MAEGESLSKQLIGSAKKYAAKGIAEKESAQYKKEGVLGGLMALVKPLAGFASKGLLSLANITSAGLLSPLLMGLGTTGITGLVDKFLRKSGMGADPSEITADSKYGFGKEEAKTISEGLEKSIEERDPFSSEGVLSDIMMSYISSLTPKINPFTGETTGGELFETLKPGGEKPTLFGKDIARKFYPNMEKVELSPSARQFTKELNPFGDRSTERLKFDLDSFPGYQQVGKVPEYYGGGSVEGGGATPTIVDHFSRKGVTLGGSNTQSLAEMLGKK